VNTYRHREVRRVLSHMPVREVEAAVRSLTAFSRAAHEASEPGWAVHGL
jgi:hypothetical protein